MSAVIGGKTAKNHRGDVRHRCSMSFVIGGKTTILAAEKSRYVRCYWRQNAEEVPLRFGLCPLLLGVKCSPVPENTTLHCVKIPGK